MGDEVQSNPARCWGPLRQQWAHLVVPSLWSLKSKCPCKTMLLEMNCKLFTPEKTEECPYSPCCWPSLHLQHVPAGRCPLSLAESATLCIGSSEDWTWPWFWGSGQNRPWAAAPLSRNTDSAHAAAQRWPLPALLRIPRLQTCFSWGFDSQAVREQHHYTLKMSSQRLFITAICQVF